MLTTADKKILASHKLIKSKVKSHVEKFQFSLAGEVLYEYFWHQFCDKYIEESKEQLSADSSQLVANTNKILIKILSESLMMLHPFVPFVTEAVWQKLREIYPALSESIMISEWPE